MRQDLARIDVGKPAGHENGVLLLVDEAADEMLGQQIDVFLDRLDVVVAVFAQPTPQAFERPDVAETGRLLRALDASPR